VDAGNRVLIKPVSLERDLGAVVEIASGLAPNDRVIENPPDGISTGTSVRLTGVGPRNADARHEMRHPNEKG
jgi:membrane fusion protein (multidrug efflux system)